MASADWTVLHGNALWWLRELPAESIDAVVTDPPYGIGFMARPSDNGAFEAGRYDFSPGANYRFQAWCHAWASELLRVLKPGGYLVAFGGTRTYHRLVWGLEDAGFEIRDQFAWLFGSGFPKNRRLGDGVGTALKPGHEPICLARAPIIGGSAAATHRLHGTAGLNVDACRIPVADTEEYARNASGDRGHAGTRDVDERGATDLRMGGGEASALGRWPANVILDPEAGALLDRQTGVLRSGANADVGGASRFFYYAKTSGRERDAGLDPAVFPDGNTHPTVKPIELMRWLARLVTPRGGVLLDLFAGSGSTGCAAVLEGIDFIGIEREPQKPDAPAYVSIAEARIAWWAPHEGRTVAEVLNDDRGPAVSAGQLGLLEDVA